MRPYGALPFVLLPPGSIEASPLYIFRGLCYNLSYAKLCEILHKGDPAAMQDNYDSPSFEQAFTYSGRDLGASWTREETRLRLWAPTAAHGPAISTTLNRMRT